MELEAGVVIAGKYRLERPIARGGMGSVWQAVHEQLKVPLAIKFMEPAYAASAVGRMRFEREATAAAQIRHPNVVHVQDYGVEGDLPYIVMELLVGEDLGKRLKRFRRLPLPVVSNLLMQTAKALRRAHESGFVHRDLKPGNIFLAKGDDNEDIIKILDFGIAKQLMPTLGSDGESTKTGEIVGSPSYMSPEQIRGARDIDARADVWSLCVILFRALTGRLPYEGDTTPDIIANILTTPPPKATQFVRDLPPALDAFFEKGLARDRDARFQSVRELADAFAAATRMPMGSMAYIDPALSTPPPDAWPNAMPTGSTSYPSGPSYTAPPGSLPSFPQMAETDPFAMTPHPAASAQSNPFAVSPSNPGSGAFPAPVSDPGFDIRATQRQERGNSFDPSGMPNNTGMPSADGTLTVSPSITGMDTFRPQQRKPIVWWIMGAGVVFGVVLGLALVLVNRSDSSGSDDPNGTDTQSASPSLSSSSAATTPALPNTAVPAQENLGAASGPSETAASSSAAPQTAPSTSASSKKGSGTGTKTPAGGTGKKPNRWGI